MQEKYSDISNCDYRKGALQWVMNGEEIRRLLRERDIKQVELANFLGMPANKLSKSLHGDRRFQVEEMDKVREFLSGTKPDTPSPTGAIPIVGDVPGGRWREAVQRSSASMPRPDPSIPANAFALKVKGDSMDLQVDDGGTVVVDPDDRDLFPNRFYVVMLDGETTFKQFKADPARLVPCSSNPAHEEIRIGSGRGFQVVGRVIWKAARM